LCHLHIYLTKLCNEVYILLFNSHVKFYTKIFTHCRNNNKSHRAYFLLDHPVYRPVGERVHSGNYMHMKYWGRKDYRIGTLRCNWPMSAQASQAYSTSTVPIRKIYLKEDELSTSELERLQNRTATLILLLLTLTLTLIWWRSDTVVLPLYSIRKQGCLKQ